MKAVSRTVNAVTRRTYLLLLGVLVVGGVTYLWSGRTAVIYRASALVSVAYSADPGQPVALRDVADAISYAHKFGSAPLPATAVAEAAAAVPERTTRQIISEVRLSPASGQPLITVSVEDVDPQVAQQLATQTALAVVHYYTAATAQAAADVVSGLQQQIVAQNAAIAQTQAELAAAQKSGGPTSVLQQTLSQQQSQLQTLQAQLTAAQRNALNPQPFITVASVATGADQVTTNNALNAVLGALAGLLAACGLALFIDYLDGSLRTVDEIKQWCGLETLATVPDAPVDDASLPLLPEIYFAVAAPFRSLLRNVRFLDAAQMQQVVLVVPVDAAPTEDWVAINLAITAALAGQRVLLLDGNWSQPSLATRFGLNDSETGFFTAVAAMKSDAELVRSAIRETGVPQLYALPVGPLPPNLSDLLKTDLLDRLFDVLREAFELIVVIAPHDLTSEPGARILEHMDGVLLSVRAGYTSGEEAGALATSLRKANAYLAGAVMVTMPVSRSRDRITPQAALAMVSSSPPTADASQVEAMPAEISANLTSPRGATSPPVVAEAEASGVEGARAQIGSAPPRREARRQRMHASESSAEEHRSERGR